MPSRRGNPSWLPALPALAEATEGPKRGLVILLMKMGSRWTLSKLLWVTVFFHANTIVAAQEEWTYALFLQSLWVILLIRSAKDLLVGCSAG
jgi:hypothetical protein